jgi:AraC-like DNA-binding protein/mannose-6-phosphate isomerase-like protein (cupin superfamily)
MIVKHRLHDNAPIGGIGSPVAFRRWDSVFFQDLFLFVSTEHDLVYANHLHDSLEIMWALAGDCEVFHRGSRFLLRTGDAVAIAPGEVHAGGACQGAPFVFASLHVPRRLVESLVDPDHDGRRARAPLTFLDGRRAAQLYGQLIGGLPSAATMSDEATCLRDALCGLYSGSTWQVTLAPTRPDHPAVRRVRASAARREFAALDLGVVAEEFGLHPNYLISLFKDAMGLPPHQYQIAHRIDRARRLLDDELSLSTVASTAGFSDQSHFNRFFKRAYAMTPGTYRTQTVPLVAQV